MSKDIQVSVVIPMYNAELTVKDTIKSIENQTRYDLVREIIVVDDGSTDSSSKIIQELIRSNNKIRLYKKENGGVASARNYGMKISKSEWIAFCDSDDIWLNKKLEIQNNIIKEHSDIDFLGGRWKEKNPKIFGSEISCLHKANLKEICITFFPQPSTVVMRKRIYEDIGGFNQNQRYAEEGIYFYKICSKYGFYYTPDLLIKFGGGKRGFGCSGLSSNLKGMYDGNVSNLKEILQMKLISHKFYAFLRILFYIKYIRRIVISKMAKVS